MHRFSSLRHAELWRLAGPMILSNLTIPLLGLVDTAVVGHLDSPHYLGAVAVGGVIFSFLYWGFGFLRMGTTGLTAQALGREEGDELRAVLARALLLALALAAALLLLQSVVARLAFSLVEASAEVEAGAALYFEVRIWSAPATLAIYALVGWFLGMQNSRAPLYLLLFTNSLNIVLDLWLVVGLEMGVAGVALASVVAEYCGAALGLALVPALLRRHPGRLRRRQMADWDALRRMATVNHHIFVRTLCLIFSFAFFTAQGAKLGDAVLAANAVLMNFQTLMAYALDGFAHAAEALVGRAVGRGDGRGLRRAIATAAFWSLLVAVLFTLLYAVAGRWVVDLLTAIETVRQAAYLYLPWLVAAPLISVWSYLFDGIFIGATHTRAMRDTMLLSTFGVYLPAWYLLQGWGNHGLWAALMLFMAARGVTMALACRTLLRSFPDRSPA